MPVPLKDKFAVTLYLHNDLHDRLIQFQGNYMAEYKKRISKQEVIVTALEAYFAKVYELSRE